jgi:hypothetical protein
MHACTLALPAKPFPAWRPDHFLPALLPLAAALFACVAVIMGKQRQNSSSSSVAFSNNCASGQSIIPVGSVGSVSEHRMGWVARILFTASRTAFVAKIRGSFIIINLGT